MAYLVLARKYRPTVFADLVGQEHIVRTLQNAIALQRVHHAFLFTGARGVGKTTTARILARALNCAQGPIADPCGTCPACLDSLAGKSSDVLEIDGASNTGVDNVRELRENVRYLPSGGRYKLYIIDEVHMLSQAAFNALLKTLEEPPPHVKFIFATTEPHKIPVTILSRCQRFDFRRVSGAALMAHLRGILDKEGMPLGPTALQAVVREAQGSVRDALSLLDQVLSYGGQNPDDATVLEALGVVDSQTVFSLFDAVLQRDANLLLQTVAELDGRGHDLGQVAGLLAAHVRDVAVIKHVAEPPAQLMELSATELEGMRAQAKQRNHGDLQRLFRQALAVAEDVGRSSMPRITFEMGLLRLLEQLPTPELATLLERLDALAAGTPVPAAGGASTVGSGTSSAASPKPRSSSAAPAPPAASSAPAAAEVAGMPSQAWVGFVDRVRSRRPAMASVLEHGRMVQFGPSGVEVAYEPGSFYWDAARDPDNNALLVKILTEQFGQSVALRVVALTDEHPAVPSLAEASEQRQNDFESKVKERALEHQAVRSAVAILGGEVKDVTPLGQA